MATNEEFGKALQDFIAPYRDDGTDPRAVAAMLVAAGVAVNVAKGLDPNLLLDTFLTSMGTCYARLDELRKERDTGKEPSK